MKNMPVTHGRTADTLTPLITVNTYGWLLLLVFLAGAAVRLYGITTQVLIDDEWHALNAVQYHDFKWILTHFGDSDHSIPLALLYKLQYHTLGLSELLMRWPMLLAGCLAVEKKGTDLLLLAAVGVVMLVCLAVLLGPIPDWPLRHNQFPLHQNYHFHYDQSKNLYRLAMQDWFQEEPFYAEIAAAHEPGEALVIEAAWHMESYSNALNLQQDIHRQRVQIGFVNGLCAGPLFGEITAGQDGMKFRNFVYLKDILEGRRDADYIVLRRHAISASARTIDMDFPSCERAVRERFGEPWRQSEFALVFKITRHD